MPGKNFKNSMVNMEKSSDFNWSGQRYGERVIITNAKGDRDRVELQRQPDP